MNVPLPPDIAAYLAAENRRRYARHMTPEEKAQQQIRRIKRKAERDRKRDQRRKNRR